MDAAAIAIAADREKRKEKHKEFLSLVLWLQSLQPLFGGSAADQGVIIRGDEKQVNVEDVLQALNRIDIAL
jgi:alanyl-tRNA synthetase